MLATKFLDQWNPESRIVLELSLLVGINDVTQVTGNR